MNKTSHWIFYIGTIIIVASVVFNSFILIKRTEPLPRVLRIEQYKKDSVKYLIFSYPGGEIKIRNYTVDSLEREINMKFVDK